MGDPHGKHEVGDAGGALFEVLEVRTAGEEGGWDVRQAEGFLASVGFEVGGEDG